MRVGHVTYESIISCDTYFSYIWITDQPSTSARLTAATAVNPTQRGVKAAFLTSLQAAVKVSLIVALCESVVNIVAAVCVVMVTTLWEPECFGGLILSTAVAKMLAFNCVVGVGLVAAVACSFPTVRNSFATLAAAGWAGCGAAVGMVIDHSALCLFGALYVRAIYICMVEIISNA